MLPSPAASVGSSTHLDTQQQQLATVTRPITKHSAITSTGGDTPSEKQLETPTYDKEKSDEETHVAKPIDVQQSKKHFFDFEKRIHNLFSHGKDLEATLEQPAQFDLRDYLLSHSEDAKAANWKFRSLGVAWSDLAVRGTASKNLKVPTIPRMALFELIGPFIKTLRAFGIDPMPPKQRFLIENFDGCAKPGELVLVIGRPGSGCSTFLQAIANKRNAFLGVDGEVNYGGITSEDVRKHYAGEIVYSEEDDNHHATLTVAQTLETILRLKQPRHTFPGYTPEEFREELLTTLLKMLSMEHTRNTLVGSATVRGVSGGERKRVSVLETFCTNGTVLSWDNATRGLDASTALDYTKTVRVLTDVMRTTSFLTAYQASEGIFDLCDKVMVIEGGRCVYFGPRDKARQYFVGLGFLDRPRSTSSDWITTCFDPKTREYQEGRSEQDVPSTPEELEQAFRSSKIHADTIAERDEYLRLVAEDTVNQQQFRQSVQESKQKHTGKKSLYNVPFWTQVWVLFLREMQIKLGDPFDIFMSFFTTITIGLLTGGLFFKLPLTSAGAFTRGGVLFILLLYNSMSTFAELSSQMMGRPILARQLTFTMYRPAALPMAQIVADIPLTLPRMTIFTIILYFMSGLRTDAGAFFTAFLIVVVSYYTFKTLFTFFGVVCRDFYGAARLAAVVISIMVQWAGYVQPLKMQHGYVKWLTYLDPVYYAFEALMINELGYISLECEGIQRVPTGPGYRNDGIGPNQVCTLPGAKPGENYVNGQDYLDQAFGFYRNHLWRDVGLLFVFLAGFLLLTCYAIESQDQGSFSSALIVTKPPNKEEEALNKRLEERRTKALRGEENEANEFKVSGKPYTWRNLCYTVPVPGGQRQLLNSIDGYVKPGTVTALMGASGAGKTTLLDVLADRKTIGVIEGDRLVSGHALDLSFQRQCGYAEQQDIHEPMCSVREALRFSAYLRQPYEVSKEEKDAFVETILELLEIGDLADAIVGVPGFGLGMGDRKRVTIGVELAAKPTSLLFLDEPTSGLDGQTALTICRLLRKLADEGQSILCTIHQPSALLFEMFDRLLLLERGGRTVYFGPIGRDATHVVEYFAERGAQMPENVNPAEYMLDIIGAGSAPRMGPKDWADWYLESGLYQDNLREIEKINMESAALPPPDAQVLEYAAPWMYQFKVVLTRTMRSTWRMPSYQYTRLIQHFVCSLLVGLLLIRLSKSLATLQYRIFALFLVIVIMAVVLAQIMPFWIQARSVWIREETSKTFSGTVFASTRLVSEVPYALGNAVVFFVLMYYMVGFQSSPSDKPGFFFVMIFLTEIYAVSLGSMIASFCKSVYVSSLFIPFIMIILSLICGVIMPVNAMSNALFSKFLYNVNPLRFLLSALTVNEFEGLNVKCLMSELYTIVPPANMTCEAYMKPYISFAGGYLDERSTNDSCLFCQYANGMEMAKGFDMYFDERARDAAFFLAFIVWQLAMTLICTKYLKFSNR